MTAAQENFAELCLEKMGRGDFGTVEKAEDVLDALLKGLKGLTAAGQRPSGMTMRVSETPSARTPGLKSSRWLQDPQRPPKGGRCP